METQYLASESAAYIGRDAKYCVSTLQDFPFDMYCWRHKILRLNTDIAEIPTKEQAHDEASLKHPPANKLTVSKKLTKKRNFNIIISNQVYLT